MVSIKLVLEKFRLGMVVKRTDRKMEGRVENVEKEVGELVMNVGGLKEVVRQFSEDIGAVKEYMKEFSVWMRSGSNMNQLTEQARVSASNGNENSSVPAEQAEKPPAEQARASASNGGDAGGATMAAYHFGYGTAPSAQSGRESRFRRMEIPLFNGEDPQVGYSG